MGAIDSDRYHCDGSDVLAELNAVFNDPNSARYKFAQSHSSFGAIKNVASNYRALIDAYKTAGVADINGWAAYLRRLGTGPKGPQRITGSPDLSQGAHPGRLHIDGHSRVRRILRHPGRIAIDRLCLRLSPRLKKRRRRRMPSPGEATSSMRATPQRLKRFSGGGRATGSDIDGVSYPPRDGTIQELNAVHKLVIMR